MIIPTKAKIVIIAISISVVVATVVATVRVVGNLAEQIEILEMYIATQCK